MCVIVHKPAGVTLGRDIFENCWAANRDGGGFAVLCPEKGLLVEKGFFKFEDFWAAWLPHQGKHAAVHFRIATHGVVNAFNCHPWKVEVPAVGERPGFTYAVVHNGILSHPSTKEKSDTGHWVDEILAPILNRDPWFLDTPAALTLVGEAVGKGNKLVVLRSDGRHWTVNGDEGIEAHDAWFSNGAFRPSTPWFSADPRLAGQRFRGDRFDFDRYDFEHRSAARMADRIAGGYSLGFDDDGCAIDDEGEAAAAAFDRDREVEEPDADDWTLTSDYRTSKAACFAPNITPDRLEVATEDAFAHLTRKQVRTLVRYAKSYATMSGIKPQFDRDAAYVELLRCEFKALCPDFEHASDGEVDLEILGSDFMTELHGMYSEVSQ